MTSRRAFGWLRFLAAAVCLAALAHRLVWGLSSQTIAGQNFFAYLTIQSNLAFTAFAIVGGLVALRRDEDPGWLTTARVLVLSWTITAGLAFALIVWQAGERGIPIDVPWSDVWLHFVIPAFTITAWVVGPGRPRASWKVVPFVVLYPVVWGLLTMWRGQYVGWYPYYFLDLRQVSGFGEFCLTCAIALLIFAAVGSALVALSRVPPPRLPARHRPRAEAQG